jgi:rhamnogalacturonyl hydrolase YesR
LTWSAALSVARRLGDTALAARLTSKFEPFLNPGTRSLVPAGGHVDERVFGVLPLELFRLTGETRYLQLGQALADQQWASTTADGITHEARYWIDDMYMITAVQVQSYRATKDEKYINHAATTMAAYLDKLQQPNGLFFHAPDSPFYWGRGNGWVAAGMAELLRSLPRNHPQRARIVEGYKKMMASLLKYQSDDGLWRQLIDRPESWAETSSTGMFTFSMVSGVKNGWLDAKTYGPAARKAWLGLVKHLDKDANVDEVCIGTNKSRQEAGPDLDKQLKFYIDRPRRTGDLHGQAPILWSASALMR